MALLLKMGAAPFHFWLPSVIQGISWLHCAVLMTLQKIAPLALTRYRVCSVSGEVVVEIFSICCSVVGGIGGLNQLLVRKVMAYSSISHMGWLLAAIMFDMLVWVHYMIIYSLIRVCLVYFLNLRQIFHLKQVSLMTGVREKVFYFMSFLSLGGLPPFLGFLPKIMVISRLACSYHIVWLVFLIFGSLLTLFFYVRLVVSTFVISRPVVKPCVRVSSDMKRSFVLMVLNLSGVLMPLGSLGIIN